jgi:acetyl-CoA/propionyl-CoA carboxylase carboxyl transferase subunit
VVENATDDTWRNVRHELDRMHLVCVAVMGHEPAVDVLHRRTLAACPAPDRPALHARLVEELAATTGAVEHAVALGVVDEIVAPAATRRRIAEVLAAAPAVRGRHKLIPL